MPLYLPFGSTELALGTASTPPDDSSIRRMLGSASDREKQAGMRAILAQIAEGADAHRFYADVVKNVPSRDLTLREMVAAFLVLYSDSEPELALMAVNSVQRMLSDPSAVVRVQALRLVSALRVVSVAPIATHFLRELANDSSRLVRIACCQAAGRVKELDPSLSRELLDILTSILARGGTDNCEVVGWALNALALHWPQRLDVLHPIFRTHVPLLPGFDESCQINVCRLLVRYCRHYMTGPEDKDCQLFVDALGPLLSSRNDAVVVEAAAAVAYAGSEADFERLAVAQHVLTLSATPAVWASIAALAAIHPAQFSAHRSQIILGLMPHDAPQVRRYALRTVLLAGGELPLLAAETSHLKFCALAWRDDQPSVRAVMQVLAALADHAEASRLARWLVALAAGGSSQSPVLMAEALMVLRVLIQQHHLETATNTLANLAVIATKDEILPSARATILWLLGTHSSDQPAMATDVLRRMLATMAIEAPEVRLQIVQLAAKLFNAYRNDSSQFDHRVPGFFAHAIHLARYDPDIDVRDRARFFGAMLSQDDNSMATLILQSTIPAPLSGAKEALDQQHNYMVDSSSALLGKRMDGYVDFEAWSLEPTGYVRDPTVYAVASAPAGAGAAASAGANADIGEGVGVGARGGNSTAKPVSSTANMVKKMSLEEFLNAEDESSSSSASDETDAESSGAESSGAESSGAESDEGESESEEGMSEEDKLNEEEPGEGKLVEGKLKHNEPVSGNSFAASGSKA